MRKIGEHGAGAFYRGAVAEKIYGYMEQNGGLISAEDLANYRVRERRAIATYYRDHRVVTMPPSSVGGLALLQMLNVLGHYDMASLPQGSAASLHVLAETMKLGNANRREGIGDTDFVEVPIAGILGESIAGEMAAGINPDRATPVAEISPMDAYPYGKQGHHASFRSGRRGQRGVPDLHPWLFLRFGSRHSRHRHYSRQPDAQFLDSRPGHPRESDRTGQARGFDHDSDHGFSTKTTN